MEFFVGIVILLVLLFFIRGVIKDDAEKAGQDTCPICGHKMEMGAMARYHCSNCGYHR